MPRVYDIAMTHQLDADDLFIHRVQEHCAARRLNFFLVEPLWVREFTAALGRGDVRVRVLLNLHSEHHLPEDAYHQLVRLAHARGTLVIDPPDVALAAFDKGRLHGRLLAAGLTVPPTIVVPQAEAPTRQLTEEEQVWLGTPFVVKPALGYGKRGVILDATSEADLRRCAAQWPEGDYLLQRRVTPVLIEGEPAYFRVYFAFGSTWLCWWNCFTDRYRVVQPEDEGRLELGGLREIATRLAQLTGMRFFSSEIARDEAGAFVLIDYVNDQCHMLCQSANPRIGVPDEVVTGLALRLVAGAHEWMGASRT